MRNHRVGVIGGGMIGASMAVLLAGNGIPVTIVKRTSLEETRDSCRNMYRDLEDHGLMTKEQAEITMTYIDVSSNYDDISQAEVVFECAPERVDIKYQIYRELETHCKNLRAVASSTSAISADELVDGFQTPDFRKRLLVAHPWNPPHLVPCVEIVRSSCTSDEAVSYVCRLLEELGKKVIVLKKNIAGFIGNRLQYAMLREAIHIVEEGIATPEMVDETLRYSFAPRYTSIGIFEHFDNCGQDLTKDICNYLFPSLCDCKEVQASVYDNCVAGRLGVKSGKGMLDWENVDTVAFRSRTAQPYYSFFHWNLPIEPAVD